jgi:hypothetical protein
MIPGFLATAAAAVREQTLNPSDKNANVVLTSGNLIGSHDATAASYAGVRGMFGLSSGKVYFEMTPQVMGTGSIMMGIADSSAPLNQYIAYDTHSLGLIRGAGTLLGFNLSASGPYITIAAAFVVGDVLCMAFNLGTKQFWARSNSQFWNASVTANPATGAEPFAPSIASSGPWFPAMSLFDPNDSCLAIFKPPFNFTPPSGYGTWDAPL